MEKRSSSDSRDDEMEGTKDDEYEHRALMGTAHDPDPPKGRNFTLLLCGVAAGIYEVRFRTRVPPHRIRVARAVRATRRL